MKTRPWALLAALVASTGAYWAGRLTTEAQVVTSSVLVQEDPAPECPACPSWAPCAVCPRAAPLALHQRTLEAQADVRVADAYLRGLEEARRLSASCDDAVEAARRCEAKACQEFEWEIEFSLMDVGIHTMMMEVETSNWSACCDELLDKWPEPLGDLGEYPEHFPSYCQ